MKRPRSSRPVLSAYYVDKKGKLRHREGAVSRIVIGFYTRTIPQDDPLYGCDCIIRPLGICIKNKHDSCD